MESKDSARVRHMLEAARTRDRLIHAYFNVELDIIWEIIMKDIPPLVSSLQHVIETEQL